jgi:hypothetical protein
MDAKQTIPVIARVAPPLLVGVAIYYGLKWLFSTDDEKKKQENAPAKFAPAPVSCPLVSIPVMPNIFMPTPIPPIPISKDLSESLPSQKKRIILREDLAHIFRHGTRSLYRVDAVAALQNLGFCKAAAYEALSPDGRFASWLRIAPDGIISWQETESKLR